AAAKLTQPQDGASLTLPPLLAWQPVASADYYNVQLWALVPSGPVKIFSIWPTTTRLQLTKSWVYRGKQHQLAKGRYRWYVWPGIGPIRRARYGALIGSNTFVIAGWAVPGQRRTLLLIALSAAIVTIAPGAARSTGSADPVTIQFQHSPLANIQT